MGGVVILGGGDVSSKGPPPSNFLRAGPPKQLPSGAFRKSNFLMQLDCLKISFRAPFGGWPRHPFPIGFTRFFNSAKSYSVLLINLMLFYTFCSLFRKWSPKVFINDRFYKGFRCLIFCCCKQRDSFLVKNLMLFDTFWRHLQKGPPKVSINGRGCMVLSMRDPPCAFY